MTLHSLVKFLQILDVSDLRILHNIDPQILLDVSDLRIFHNIDPQILLEVVDPQIIDVLGLPVLDVSDLRVLDVTGLQILLDLIDLLILLDLIGLQIFLDVIGLQILLDVISLQILLGVIGLQILLGVIVLPNISVSLVPRISVVLLRNLSVDALLQTTRTVADVLHRNRDVETCPCRGLVEEGVITAPTTTIVVDASVAPCALPSVVDDPTVVALIARAARRPRSLPLGRHIVVDDAVLHLRTDPAVTVAHRRPVTDVAAPRRFIEHQPIVAAVPPAMTAAVAPDPDRGSASRRDVVPLDRRVRVPPRPR